MAATNAQVTWVRLTIPAAAPGVRGVVTWVRFTAPPAFIGVNVTLSATTSLVAGTFATCSATASMVAQSASTFYFPTSDGTNNGWITDQGSSSNLFSRVNEPVPDDTNYDQSPVNPVLTPLTLAFSPITPIGGQQARVHIRYDKNQLGDTDDLMIELLQTGTLVQSWVLYDIPVGVQQFNAVVTTPITDWSALTIRLTPWIMSSSPTAIASSSSTPNFRASLSANATLATTTAVSSGATCSSSATLTTAQRVAEGATATAQTSLSATDTILGNAGLSATTLLTTGAPSVSGRSSLSAAASLSTSTQLLAIIEPVVIF